MNSMPSWILSKTMTIVLMIPLVSAYSFSLDLYIPLVPTIQEEFGVSIQKMQLTNSLFMLTCGVAQLIFGPLSDHYGRRKILFFSLILSIIANTTCFYATSFDVFLSGKILQAVGSCGAYLSCFATIRDLYDDPDTSTEMFSYLNVANSTSAIIAPSIGTVIGVYFGWQWIFFALLLYALFSMSSSYAFFHETTPAEKPSKKRNVLNEYRIIFSHINYQVFTLPAALGISSFFAYYSISPYLYQQTFGLSEGLYSILFGSCGLTFFFSSYFCGRLVKQKGITNTLILGLSIHGIGCVLMIASTLLAGTYQLVLMHLSVLLVIFGSALMVSAGIGGTMSPFSHVAGSAFAMISCYKFGLCYILGELAVMLYDTTIVPLAIMLLSINLIAASIVYIYRGSLVLKAVSQTTDMTKVMSDITDDIL
ncbi:MAG: hypothetical protein CMF46_01500 [Legionellales bacterium]|nr:hypothetical protein [Legionellales bacterium]